MAKKPKGFSGLITKRKTKHPSDAFRKRLRKKEIRRNKEMREKIKDALVPNKDGQAIEKELERLSKLEKQNKLTEELLTKKKYLFHVYSRSLNNMKFGKPDSSKKSEKDIKNEVNNKENDNISSKENLEITNLLNSFDADDSPFLPPGLSISDELRTPPGIVHIKIEKINSQGQNMIRNKNNIIKTNMNIYRNKETSANILVPNKKITTNIERRKYECDLLDPLNPLYRCEKIKSKKKEKKITKDLPFIGPVKEKEKKNIYSRKEELKISEGIKAFVPISIYKGYRDKNKEVRIKRNNVRKLNLAPTINLNDKTKTADNDNDVYDEFMKDIEGIGSRID